MYYFIATVFFYGMPCLAILYFQPFWGNKRIWLRLLVTLELSMIFHSLFFVRQLIGLYQLAKTMGLKSHDYLPPLLESVQVLVIIIWPFFLLNKKLAAKFWAGLPLWLVLFSLPRFISFENDPLKLLVNSLFVLSLLTGMFGFLWLLKRFPDQSS